jgi:hypothetical protein
LWIGLLCGFCLGGTVTQQVYRFKTSGYSTWSREVSESVNLAWRVLAFPASLIRPIPNATDATPGELSFVLTTNGLLLGALGALVGWRIDKRRNWKVAEHRLVPESQVDETPQGKTFGVVVRKASMVGFAVGFGATLGLATVSYVAGHGVYWLVGWLLFMPTDVLSQAVGYTWPTYAVPTMWQNVRGWLLVSFINGVLVGIPYCLAKGLKKLMRN